jgi:hypothetical protein
MRKANVKSNGFIIKEPCDNPVLTGKKKKSNHCWTKFPPKKSGFYWFWKSGDKNPTIVDLRREKSGTYYCSPLISKADAHKAGMYGWTVRAQNGEVTHRLFLDPYVPKGHWWPIPIVWPKFYEKKYDDQ